MKCPGCGVELSKREATEGCGVCDWEPGRAACLQERRAVRSESAKAAEIQEAIFAEKRYRFATNLARYLVEQYAGEATWKSKPVIWRNLSSSCHTKDLRDGKHQIALGYQSIDITFFDGMREYQTWRWIWAGGLKKRLEGVYQEVVHEFAHALQSERNGRHYGAAHTTVWAQAVKEIQTLVPFEDVEYLAN